MWNEVDGEGVRVARKEKKNISVIGPEQNLFLKCRF